MKKKKSGAADVIIILCSWGFFLMNFTIDSVCVCVCVFVDIRFLKHHIPISKIYGSHTHTQRAPEKQVNKKPK